MSMNTQRRTVGQDRGGIFHVGEVAAAVLAGLQNRTEESPVAEAPRKNSDRESVGAIAAWAVPEACESSLGRELVSERLF